jgi:prepilin-type N-terminal cleavage/methylation domain-containing protein
MRASGFTLVELMIVVVIVGVLATVAGTAYKKYTNQGRTVEVMAMMGEFRAKEEAYKAEFNVYCSSGGATCATATTETTYFPALLATGEPAAKDITVAPSGPPPGAWTQLGIQPQRKSLYCGIVAVAGAANVAPVGGDGIAILSQFAASTPPVPWYYLHATCDNDGNSVVNAIWTTAFNSTSVATQNTNK